MPEAQDTPLHGSGDLLEHRFWLMPQDGNIRKKMATRKDRLDSMPTEEEGWGKGNTWKEIVTDGKQGK